MNQRNFRFPYPHFQDFKSSILWPRTFSFKTRPIQTDVQFCAPPYYIYIYMSYHVFVSEKHSSFEIQQSTFLGQTCHDKQSTYSISFAPECNKFTGHAVLKFLLCHPPMALRNTKKLSPLCVHQLTESWSFKIPVQQVAIWSTALCCRAATRTTHRQLQRAGEWINFYTLQISSARLDCSDWHFIPFTFFL